MTVTFQNMPLEFSLAEADPALWSRLPSQVQAIAGEWMSTGRIPTADIVAPFHAPPFVKPRFHVRAMYRCVDGHGFDQGVIALKGTETAARDMRLALQTMTAGRPYVNRIELFMYQEYKLPIAVRLREALLDARKALALNQALWTTFEEQAPIPVPLGVFRWPVEHQRAYEDELQKVLSDTGAEVAEQLQDSLGVLVYYFPRSPIRVRHLRHEKTSAYPNAAGRAERVRSWVELAARLMVAGYFPCTLDNQRQGCCLSDQNVCVDGGFVDIDSIKRMSDITDPGLFHGNLLLTVAMLAHSCAVYLSGEKTVASHPAFEQVVTMHSIFGSNLAGALYLPAIWRDLTSALQRLIEAGHTVDKRLETLLKKDSGADLLVELTSRIPGQSESSSEMTFHTSVKHPFEAP